MRNEYRMKKKLLLLSSLMIAALVVSGLWSTKAINLLVREQTVEPTETSLAAGLSTQAQADKQTRARVSEAFGKLPLYFVENRGQLDKRVAYYVQGSDKTIYFSDQGLTFVLTGMRNPGLRHKLIHTGANQFLTKPFQFDELLHELSRFIDLFECERKSNLLEEHNDDQKVHSCRG